MKFFNIDLHISVIEDLKRIFLDFTSQIDEHSLSGHTWVFGKQKATLKVIRSDNWQTLDQSMCNRFYQEYRNELRSYDGFVCTYPPAFAMLYEKFDKPIILQVPIRLEVPFQNQPDKLIWFIDFLKRGIDSRQIIPVCNNLYDKKYCEQQTNREWLLIPSLCDYTGINYQVGEDFVLYSRFKTAVNLPHVKTKEDYLGNRYSWDAFSHVKGVIHFPYNVSTMSIFEQYTANLPLLFPSLEFNMELYKQGFTLSEISWGNKKKDSIDWVALSDYYSKEWMPNIVYFSSFNELKTLVSALDCEKVSGSMAQDNKRRKVNIYALWQEVLNGLGS